VAAKRAGGFEAQFRSTVPRHGVIWFAFAPPRANDLNYGMAIITATNIAK